MMTKNINIYRSISQDKLRYSDTDRQGHVNNAKFSTFLETGRVEILYNPARITRDENTEFVIASLDIQYKSEILWPGFVDIGTTVNSIGTSSIILEQGIFQGGKLCATASTVIVQVCTLTRKSKALCVELINQLTAYSNLK